jgi:hypothetical protein
MIEDPERRADEDQRTVGTVRPAKKTTRSRKAA